MLKTFKDIKQITNKINGLKQNTLRFKLGEENSSSEIPYNKDITPEATIYNEAIDDVLNLLKEIFQKRS